MPGLIRTLTCIGVALAVASILIPPLMGFALIFLLTGWLVGDLDKRGELDSVRTDLKLWWRRRWPDHDDGRWR